MRHCILLIALLFSMTLTAQKYLMKWGKISQEHLDMTVYEADSSANAVVLCDFGTTNFEIGTVISARFNRHVRIKLLNQAAVDKYGDIVIGHYSDEPLTGLKANVIQQDGTITTLGKKEWFTEKVTKERYLKKISLPQLKPGVIIEYKYQLTDNSWTSIPSWKFQKDIPIIHSEFRVDMPEWFIYVELMKGNVPLDISVNRHTEVLNGYSVSLEMKTFIAQNVPALKEEPYVSTMDDYLTSIRFQLSEFRPTSAPWQKFMTSWEDVSKILTKDIYFGGQYLRSGKNEKMGEAVAPKLVGLTSDKEKAIAIYNYVNDNIKTKEGGSSIYTENSVSDVLKDRTGTEAEQNLLMLSMLSAHEITAFPILLSTRSNGEPLPYYPYVGQFDHMMVCVMINGEPLYLDAGSSFHPAGMTRMDALNKKGLIISETPMWMDIIPQRSSDIILANLKIDLEGSVAGDFTINSSGYSAANERFDFEESSAKEIWEERLVDKYPDATIENATVENQEEIYEPLKCILNISIPSAAQVSGDFIYLNPIFYTTFDENPFKLAKRGFPVDIPYPIKEQLIFNFEVPDGYVLDGPPENLKLSIPNKGGSFQFMISQTDNKVQVICKLMVNKLYYPTNEYYEIKQFFDVFMEKVGEQLVLKKA